MRRTADLSEVPSKAMHALGRIGRKQTDSRFRLFMLACVLIVSGAACAEPAANRDGHFAASNPDRVPDVVGMKLARACRILAESNYRGGVWRILSKTAGPPQTVVTQRPAAGSQEAALGEIIFLKVAAPLPENRFPGDYVNRLRADSRP